jgi:hypothetical protein
MTDDDVAQIMNGQLLYVYGVATYHDAFGCEHRTTWSNKYNGGLGPDTHFSLTGKHEGID